MFPEFLCKMTMEQRLHDDTKVFKLAKKERKLFLSLQSAFCTDRL